METTFNLKHTIDQIVKEKGIDRSIILEALEQAVLSAANKKFRNTRELEAHYSEEAGEVELFEFVTVVDEVKDSYKEINLEEAREDDPDVAGNKRKTFLGTLFDFNGTLITMKLQEGQMAEIPLNMVAKANLEFEF